MEGAAGAAEANPEGKESFALLPFTFPFDLLRFFEFDWEASIEVDMPDELLERWKGRWRRVS